VVIISLNLLPERKDNFTSNAIMVTHGLQAAAEELQLVLETCSYVSLKQQGKFSLG
jgi:hypothetical protein